MERPHTGHKADQRQEPRSSRTSPWFHRLPTPTPRGRHSMIQRRDESAPLGLVAHKAGLGLPQGPHGPVNSAPERPKAQGMLTRTPHGPVDSGLVRRKARSILALCATRGHLVALWHTSSERIGPVAHKAGSFLALAQPLPGLVAHGASTELGWTAQPGGTLSRAARPGRGYRGR